MNLFILKSILFLPLIGVASASPTASKTNSSSIILGDVPEFDCDNPYVTMLLLKATGHCFPPGFADVCPPLMAVKPKAGSEKEGECVCKKFTARNCGTRPTAYSPKDRRCYFLFQQGPCQNGSWVVGDKKGHAKCQVNPCSHPGNENEEIPDDWDWCMEHGEGKARAQFYFSTTLNNGSPKCYQTRTQAYCSRGEQVDFASGSSNNLPACSPLPLHVNGTDGESMCRSDCDFCGCGSISKSSQLRCPEGTRRDVSGICLPISDF